MWHYNYRIVVTHRGETIERAIRKKSDHPHDRRLSSQAVHKDREEVREKIIAEIDAMFEAGTPLTGLTLDQLADRWEADAKRRGVVMTTVKHMIPIIKETLPSSIQTSVDVGTRGAWSGLAADIKPADVRSWIRSLQTDRDLGPRASNHYLSILSGWYNLAIDDDELDANPAARVRREKLPKKRAAAFSLHQMQAILAALDDFEARAADLPTPACGIHPPMRGLVLAALFTAARPANVLGLRWEWIRFDENLIQFPAEVFKTSKDHTIPMLAPLREWLLTQWTPEAQGHVFVNPQTGAPFKRILTSWNILKGLADVRLEKEGRPSLPMGARFRFLCPLGCGGSSPPFRTNFILNDLARNRGLFLCLIYASKKSMSQKMSQKRTIKR
ncbi:hypothetical protein N9X87_00015 [bacterium]|nr:hypothetical protein [bacterium]